jgi:hypothetical protein
MLKDSYTRSLPSTTCSLARTGLTQTGAARWRQRVVVWRSCCRKRRHELHTGRVRGAVTAH